MLVQCPFKYMYKNTLITIIRIAKKNIIPISFDDRKNNTKQTGKALNDLLGRSSKYQVSDTSDIYGVFTSDPEHIASDLNDS